MISQQLKENLEFCPQGIIFGSGFLDFSLEVFLLLFLPNVIQQQQGQTCGVFLTLCSIFLEVSFLRAIHF